eukprot:4171774-Pleurochrysis_carterae.AAC.1
MCVLPSPQRLVELVLARVHPPLQREAMPQLRSHLHATDDGIHATTICHHRKTPPLHQYREKRRRPAKPGRTEDPTIRKRFLNFAGRP